MAITQNWQDAHRRWHDLIVVLATRLHIGGYQRAEHYVAGESGADSEKQRAFEEFFWRFERQIFGYLWRMTGNEQSALDLSQETFFRAWQHFGQLQQPEASGSWLYRVATNLALTHLRRHKPHTLLPLTEDLLDPMRQHDAIVERDAVEQTLLALTPKQRAALVLFAVNDLSYAEIGKILGLSQESVKKILQRARAQFRASYMQEGDNQ